MAKASPLIRSFNGGEVSKLVEGRTDLDRYPASMRKLLNCVAAPQGPALCRSGTLFVGTSFKPDKKSVLIPFVFSEEAGNAYAMEFTDGRVRFWNDTGLLIYAPVSATGTSTAPFEFDSPDLTALGAAIGDQVALFDFADSYNLNSEVVNITNKVGDVYTIDKVYPVGAALDVDITVGLVYKADSPYTEDQIQEVVDLQSLDVVYLFHELVPTYKLKRSNTYAWSFEKVDFLDGPYMDENDTAVTFKPSARGGHVPVMTSDVLPAGSTAFGSSNTAGHEYYRAFDKDPDTYWESNTNQTGTLGYQSAVAFVCDGYCIRAALANADASFTIKDYAPSTWTFEASNDGVNYVVLDSKNTYVLYDSNKSLFFSINNTTAYLYYRLVIKSVTRNGALKPRIASFVLRSTVSKSITITASSITAINNGAGFVATDVGRLMRVKGTDSTWRPLKITAVTDDLNVVATLGGEPFADTEAVTQWRLGFWSDTTGWPVYGTFYQDRLWLGGSTANPDLIVSSNSLKYETMTPSDPDGVVLDTHSVVLRLNSRKLARIRWMEEGDKGLMVGAGSREWVISAAEGAGKTITPDNGRATGASSRGSAKVPPIAIDNQVVYVQRGGRTLREFAYVYDVDGFKSPSMSLLASHLGEFPFEELAYAAEPYSIIWCRRRNGTVVGLTYNRDENVVGWHTQDFSGGVIESLCVIPSEDGLQDVLWMVVKRNVDGSDVRYIEKLTRFWDFGMTKNDAHYVDCALRYVGDPTDVVFGVQHLEGRADIYGLADGLPFGPKSIVNGALTLDREAENIIFGIGFDSEGETSSLENGAQDGTAQGKKKRINSVTTNLWDSYGGEFGTWNEDLREVVYAPVEYPGSDASFEEINLYSGIVGPTIMQPGYEKRGSISFRRPKESPLPFNIISIMPQMNTQDGG